MSDLDRDPQRRRDHQRTNSLAVLLAIALGFVVGSFAVYSYFGARQMDETAASQGLPQAAPPQDSPAQRPATTGSNVPAAAPSPQR